MFIIRLKKDIRKSLFTIFDCDLMKAKGTGGERPGHKYIKRVMVGGRYRYIYPGDLKGKKVRDLKESAEHHVKQRNVNQLPEHRLNNQESAYVKEAAEHMQQYMQKNKVDPMNDRAFEVGFQAYLNEHGLSPKQLSQAYSTMKTKVAASVLIENATLYHTLAREAVREHMINKKDPIYRYLKPSENLAGVPERVSRVAAKKKVATVKTKEDKKPKEKKKKLVLVRKEPGQPAYTNKKYPVNHPLSMPLKDGKKYYTETYVKNVPPGWAKDKKAWAETVDKYKEQGGKTGYNWDFSKTRKIYNEVSGGGTTSGVKGFEKFKATDMLPRSQIYRNPPEFAKDYPDVWKMVVDDPRHGLDKENFPTHIQKKAYEDAIFGMSFHFKNKVAKMQREGLIKKIKKSFVLFFKRN